MRRSGAGARSAAEAKAVALSFEPKIPNIVLVVECRLKKPENPYCIYNKQ